MKRSGDQKNSSSKKVASPKSSSAVCSTVTIFSKGVPMEAREGTSKQKERCAYTRGRGYLRGIEKEGAAFLI